MGEDRPREAPRRYSGLIVDGATEKQDRQDERIQEDGAGRPSIAKQWCTKGANKAKITPQSHGIPEVKEMAVCCFALARLSADATAFSQFSLRLFRQDICGYA